MAKSMILAAACLTACGGGSSGSAARPAPRSAAASVPRDGVVRNWPAQGIKRVVLRCGLGLEASVVVRDGNTIEVFGSPSGSAKGYHSPDPDWKETAAKDWGLDFVSQPFGDVLVVSSKNEIVYIHHGYLLRDVVIRVPPGVEVVRERREPTGQGAPDLSPPARP